MTNEMWTHENMLKEYKDGFRSGIQYSLGLLEILEKDVIEDGKISESLWIKLCTETLEDELSMYVVGDEE